MQIVTRREAKLAGKVRYFTGKPCPHTHVSERLVSSSGCIECSATKKALWNRENRGRVAGTRRAWAAANPERNKVIKATWNAENPEGQKARSRRWYLANKAKADAATAKWRASNLDVACAAQARRRARLLQQTPSWANHASILIFYREAKRLTEETGVEHHVDHIVPLQSPLVSGLHVESNLQVLPGAINRSKSNRLVEGYL